MKVFKYKSLKLNIFTDDFNLDINIIQARSVKLSIIHFFIKGE